MCLLSYVLVGFLVNLYNLHMINRVRIVDLVVRHVMRAVAHRLEHAAHARMRQGAAGAEVASELFSLASELEAESNDSHVLRGIHVT